MMKNENINLKVLLPHLKVMVADDSPIMCLAIQQYLTDFQIETITIVHNGIEALEHSQKKRYNLVILDINMPFMDGITCLKKLMQSSAPPAVLVISSLLDKETRNQVFKCGAKSFLPKPFTRHQLQEAFIKTAFPESQENNELNL
jgi:CheY-like chemotaxis protein